MARLGSKPFQIFTQALKGRTSSNSSQTDLEQTLLPPSHTSSFPLPKASTSHPDNITDLHGRRRSATLPTSQEAPPRKTLIKTPDGKWTFVTKDANESTSASPSMTSPISSTDNLPGTYEPTLPTPSVGLEESTTVASPTTTTKDRETTMEGLVANQDFSAPAKHSNPDRMLDEKGSSQERTSLERNTKRQGIFLPENVDFATLDELPSFEDTALSQISKHEGTQGRRRSTTHSGIATTTSLEALEEPLSNADKRLTTVDRIPGSIRKDTTKLLGEKDKPLTKLTRQVGIWASKPIDFITPNKRSETLPSSSSDAATSPTNNKEEPKGLKHRSLSSPQLGTLAQSTGFINPHEEKQSKHKIGQETKRWNVKDENGRVEDGSDNRFDKKPGEEAELAAIPDWLKEGRLEKKSNNDLP